LKPTAAPPRTEIAGFKLSAAERAELDRLIDALGFTTRSAGLRALVLGWLAASHHWLDQREAA